MMMLTMKMSFEEAVATQFKVNPYFESQWKRIIESDYLNKSLVL